MKPQALELATLDQRGGVPAFSTLKRSLVAGLGGPNYPVIPTGRRRGRPARG